MEREIRDPATADEELDQFHGWRGHRQLLVCPTCGTVHEDDGDVCDECGQKLR